jgi:nucleoside-diphosphate-sugar epimerase
MRVLLMGGTRFIGRHVCGKLLSHGHKVVCFHRGKSLGAPCTDVEYIKGDRRTRDIEKLAELKPEYVIDLSGYHPDDIKDIISVIGKGLKRYVFCSTAAVYDDSIDNPIYETDAIKKYMPSKRGEDYSVNYASNKVGCEQDVKKFAKQHGFEYVILRPVIVYGQYDYTERLAYWVRRVRSGVVKVPGDGMNIVRLVYAEDLAEAFVTSLTSKNAKNRTYNIADEGIFSLKEIIEAIIKVMGVQAEIKHLSPDEFKARGSMVESFPLCYPRHAIVDIAASRHDLDYRSTPFREALKKTIASIK